MLLLTQGTGHLIQIVTDAAGDIETDVAYVDKTGTGPASYSFAGVGDPLASITSATTTTTLTGAAATERAVERLSYYNNHASQAVTCTIQVLDGTHTVTLAKCVLAAGETLYMNAAGDWFHLDANGGPYVGIGPMATQAEMEAGTSVTTVVTPGRLRYAPSTSGAWGRFTVTGTTTAGYNVDTPTDNGTGDITVNFTTDFSASTAYEIQVSVEMTSTTYTVANARTPHIRSAGLAVGTVRCDCIDATVITQLVKDPSSWHMVAHGDFA